MLDPVDYALIVSETNPAPPESSEQQSTTGHLSDREQFQADRAQFQRARRATTRYHIKRDATSATAAIDRALQTYAAYLDPEILYSVSELRRSRWLWQLQNLGPRMPVDFGLLDGKFRRDDDIGYQHFWAIVEKLWNEDDGLYRDSANKELWGPDHFIIKQLVSSQRRLP
jgi:hypothetical protein